MERADNNLDPAEQYGPSERKSPGLSPRPILAFCGYLQVCMHPYSAGVQ